MHKAQPGEVQRRGATGDVTKAGEIRRPKATGDETRWPAATGHPSKPEATGDETSRHPSRRPETRRPAARRPEIRAGEATQAEAKPHQARRREAPVRESNHDLGHATGGCRSSELRWWSEAGSRDNRFGPTPRSTWHLPEVTRAAINGPNSTAKSGATVNAAKPPEATRPEATGPRHGGDGDDAAAAVLRPKSGPPAESFCKPACSLASS